MISQQEALDALGITTAQLAALGKIGTAISMLDAASVGAGGTGYSAIGLALGISINGLAAQITASQEQAKATRAAAHAQNIADEAARHDDMVLIAANDLDPAQTVELIMATAQARAQVAGMRFDNMARTEAAEASAQALEAAIPALRLRLNRLSTGDLSAV